MTRGTKILSAVGVAILVVAGGFTYARAQSGDDGDGDEVDTPISGSDLERASAAALVATGGGRVTGTEVGDEESYYEVEITLEDGSQVDVQLDESFHVVGSEDDAEADD